MVKVHYETQTFSILLVSSSQRVAIVTLATCTQYQSFYQRWRRGRGGSSGEKNVLNKIYFFSPRNGDVWLNITFINYLSPPKWKFLIQTILLSSKMLNLHSHFLFFGKGQQFSQTFCRGKGEEIRPQPSELSSLVSTQVGNQKCESTGEGKFTFRFQCTISVFTVYF